MNRIIDETTIEKQLENAESPCESRLREICAKACELNGLNMSDIIALTLVDDPKLLEAVFSTAKYVKETIYGRRMVIFAPLYISNYCQNDCLYCAFRSKNIAVQRRMLTQKEIAEETYALLNQGQKRVLLVAGDAYPGGDFNYVLDAIKTVYSVKSAFGEIRRINVNIAPLTVEEFKQLKAAGIGTYQVFQETYHRPTYEAVHVGGKKADYDWRITAVDRAMDAGIDDVGIGVLFGLHDWRFEMLALMHHISHLEKNFGVGPHTISVPRLEPASGSELSAHPPKTVSDLDFLKIVAILRLAVPYTGIIMSTRETPQTRRETFALGVSQISAGSRTDPGGYAKAQSETTSQFSLGDHRCLDEVIQDLIRLGYIPSFCTACYRLGRTGRDFMDLAKPGLIKEHCEPNALSTFMEYLMDYGSELSKSAGSKLIENTLQKLPQTAKRRTAEMLNKVKNGNHDVFC